jgi:hypothetical protein
MQPLRSVIRLAALAFVLAQGFSEFVTLQRWRLRAWMAR